MTKVKTKFFLGYVRCNPRNKTDIESEDFGECAVNSVCIYTGLPYEKLRNDIMKINKIHCGKNTFRYGTDVDSEEFMEYMNSLGLKKVNLFENELLSISEVYEKYGDCVAYFSGDKDEYHMTCIKNGKVFDYRDDRLVSFISREIKNENEYKYFKRQGAEMKWIGDNYFVKGTFEPCVEGIFLND